MKDKPYIQLYDYQEEMLGRIRESFRTHRSVMAQMPTGTGKTYLLAAVVYSCLTGGIKKNPSEVWIVAHRRELVEQIEATIAKWKRAFQEKLNGEVKVMSIQWLSQHSDEIKSAPGLVVIDEAHHALAKTYNIMWKRYPKAIFLGLTATPYRLNRMGFTDLFDELITSKTVLEFIQSGHLSFFDYVSLRPNSEDQRLIDNLLKRGTDGDYQVKEMSTVLNTRPSIERLYQSVERYANGRKGIVYAINIEHARAIAEYYNERGIGAVAIDSNTPAKQRQALIEEFKNANGIKVLVNVDIFSEGFDCPDVEFIQLARPTLSLAKYLQMVGRGLRKSKGKTTCIIIDNVGLYKSFGLPTQPWDWQGLFAGKYYRRRLKDNSSMLMPRANKYGAINTVDESFQSQSETCGSMVTVMNSAMLQTAISKYEENNKGCNHATSFGYESFKKDGLVGVLKDDKVIVEPKYSRTQIYSHYAIVDFRKDGDYAMGLVDLRTGKFLIGLDAEHTGLTFRDGDVVSYRNKNVEGDGIYDLKSGLDIQFDYFKDKGWSLWKVGDLSLLRVNNDCYTRTRKVYHVAYPISKSDVEWHDYYITINDPGAPRRMKVCVLAGDDEQYYWLLAANPDGSIYVMDESERYYHVKKDCCKSRISKDDVVNINKDAATSNAQSADAPQRIVEPVKMGSKWGLKADGKLVVAPKYLSIVKLSPKYFAIELYHAQWGVMDMTGNVIIEPKYPKVELSSDGKTILLHTVTGKIINFAAQ